MGLIQQYKNQRDSLYQGYHKLRYGYNTASDLWGLTDTLTNFILPRIIAFRDMNRFGYPNGVKSEKEWNKNIDQMVLAFQTLKEESEREIFSYSLSKKELKKEKKQIEVGLQLFAKYYRNLWD